MVWELDELWCCRCLPQLGNTIWWRHQRHWCRRRRSAVNIMLGRRQRGYCGCHIPVPQCLRTWKPGWRVVHAVAIRSNNLDLLRSLFFLLLAMLPILCIYMSYYVYVAQNQLLSQSYSSSTLSVPFTQHKVITRGLSLLISENSSNHQFLERLWCRWPSYYQRLALPPGCFTGHLSTDIGNIRVPITRHWSVIWV